MDLRFFFSSFHPPSTINTQTDTHKKKSKEKRKEVIAPAEGVFVVVVLRGC